MECVFMILAKSRKNFWYVFFLLLPLLSGINYGQDKTTEEIYEQYFGKMSRAEKIGQMNQLNYEKSKKEEIAAKIRKGEVGSLLNADPEDVNWLQKIAVEESPSGIPLILGRDVIHGFKTVFPIPLGQAAVFDPQLVEDAARIAAKESRENGINWTFAPMLDISRDARWGRIAESLGEDPYLTSVLGKAMVKGFQGDDLSSPHSIAACLKHFVGYGASEGGRDYNTTHIPYHSMRNTYLVPFYETVMAGAVTVMTSFNENDGLPTSANSFLLKDILRGEWGFDGFVVSDWDAVMELVPQGIAKDKKEAAIIAANAGTDMEMVSQAYIAHLNEAVNQGAVSEETINTAVKNILRIKHRMGLFNNPYLDIPEKKSFYSDEHMAKAREAAVKSAILLKNDNGILPLGQSLKVAVIGPMAHAPHDQLGTWSFDGEMERTVTPLKALETEYNHINYVYEPVLAYSRERNTSAFEKAKQAVAAADVAVVFVGEESMLSGEAHSLSDINLIGVQSDLLREVKSVGKPVVMVVMAGRPLTIERDLPYADAVLYSFHPGIMGGPAIFDILFGKENPSGRLPVTFVREVGQIPMYYNHNNTGRPAPDNVKTLDQLPVQEAQSSIGFRSYYMDSGRDPLFPFGYGLSYSSYEYSDLGLSSSSIPVGGELKIKVTVKNVSNTDGTEVVQLYVRDLVGSIVRPVKELKGFQRVMLKAGEEKAVEFTLSTDDLAFYGADGSKRAEPGDFDLWVGPASNKGIKTRFSIQ